LTLNGYDGSKLLKKAPTRTRYVAVTKPQSNERIQAIKRAKTAGQMFYATGGKHVNTNEFFKAKKLLSNDALIKALEDKKKAHAKTVIEQKDAVMMIRQKGDLTSINHKDFTLTEVKALLKWKKGQVKVHQKEGPDQGIHQSTQAIKAHQGMVTIGGSRAAGAAQTRS
jgi:hypothetical protein